MRNCVATSNVTLIMNAMLRLGAIANVHDLCSGTNQCDDKIVRLQLQSSNDKMQSYACDCNCCLCASPQVNMKVNDVILWLWSNLWKIVKLTGLSMILASYYGINLPKFEVTMTAWVPYIWGDCTHCYICHRLCENKNAICVRLTSLNAKPPNNSVTYRAPEPTHYPLATWA